MLFALHAIASGPQDDSSERKGITKGRGGKSLLTARVSCGIFIKTAISNRRSTVSYEMRKNEGLVIADG
jgi:hypothetical protein